MTTLRSALSATGSPDVGRHYERLSIEDFGAHLLDTGDLDPIYIALHKMELDEDYLKRWLLAYWCYYDAGVACWMSTLTDPELYWDTMMMAAENTTPPPVNVNMRWPRGHERRHFRGQQGIDAIKSLRMRYPSGPSGLFTKLCLQELNPAPFATISKMVQEERGFGPWISFKVGDMLDRLDILPVSFEQAEVFMFKDPTEAALRLWRLKGGMNETAMPKDKGQAINQVVGYLRHHFKDHTAPPRHERAVDLQEVETILCKWKSHMNGHYPMQNDTIEIRAGLEPWRRGCQIASLMISCMPEITT